MYLGFGDKIKMMRFAECLATTLMVGLWGTGAIAAPPGFVLHYAGYAWSGTAAAGTSSFPYSAALGVSALQQELNRRIVRVGSKEFTFSSELGNTKSGDSLAVAFVLTWENAAQERVDSHYKVTADVRAEALIFDFEAKKVIAAIPFGVERRDVLPRPPSKEDLLDDFREIYFGRTHNIFDAFVNTLNSADIKPAYGAYTQLINVQFEDNARSVFSTLGADPNQVKSFVASAFDASLSTNASIPVLPFIAGQAIGGVMAARFANGDVFDFKLPRPDFPISLIVRGFKKVVVDSNAIETGLAYATFVHLTIAQPLRDAPYIDADFKYAVPKTVPRTVATTDDWTAFQESILALIDGLTRQLKKPDDGWTRQWADGPATGTQLAAAAEALARCR
jgi:hypothetical protein